MHDVIIIGGGPAGLTSGIYASRSGLDAIVIDMGVAGGLAATAPMIENYPGFESIRGLDLTGAIEKHCSKYCEIVEGEAIVEIARGEAIFNLSGEKNTYASRAIIIATGTKHRKLGVPGEDSLAGRGVSYCATCDGFFFRDKRVVVVGGGNTAAVDALYLRSVGAEVLLVHRRDELRMDKTLQKALIDSGVQLILRATIENISGEKRVESVLLSDGQKIGCNGVFVAIGTEPNSTVFERSDLKVDKWGYIEVDGSQRTSMDNVYAAGDVTGGMKQVIIACAQGAMAANTAYRDLVSPYWA